MNRLIGGVCLGLLMVVGLAAVASAQDAPVYNHDIKPSSWSKPVYPQIARSARIQGSVVVQVMLDDQGSVVSATAVSGTKFLISTALGNATTWRFTPNAGKKAVIIYEYRLGGELCSDKVPDNTVTLTLDNVMTITACESVWMPSTAQTSR